jgi:hypothetical protein
MCHLLNQAVGTSVTVRPSFKVLPQTFGGSHSVLSAGDRLHQAIVARPIEKVSSRRNKAQAILASLLASATTTVL